MTHLTEEQFEDLLQDGANVPEHVGRCPECRVRLDEKRALAHRVRGAFSSIQAGPDLAGRIRAQVAAAAQPRPRTILLHLHRHLQFGLGVAAAILIGALSISLYVGTGSQTKAAQAALIGIHQTNISTLGQSAGDSAPDHLAGDVENRVGYRLAMPCAGCGMSACGCTVREFCGRPAVTYVVKGVNAPVSIIVVPDSPKALGMTPAGEKAPGGRAVWQSRRGGCNMASVRIGEYSYCAVGQVTPEELARVLSSLSL
jgi:anti-sigma factor RsiW